MVAGVYAANTVGHINPAPLQRYRPLISDPLSGLLTPDVYLSNGSGASLPTINMASTGQGICRNQDPCILPPGTYQIQIRDVSGKMQTKDVTVATDAVKVRFDEKSKQ